jgi:hypothetical protein
MISYLFLENQLITDSYKNQSFYFHKYKSSDNIVVNNLLTKC